MTTNTTTSSREEMIREIEKIVANKELSFGCRIVENNTIYNIQDAYWCYVGWDWDIYREWWDSDEDIEIEIEKIIWHPVMIWDVMDFIWNNLVSKIFSSPESEEEADQLNSLIQDFINQKTGEIIELWNLKRKPIEEQSNECIEFVYNLIKK